MNTVYRLQSSGIFAFQNSNEKDRAKEQDMNA